LPGLFRYHSPNIPMAAIRRHARRIAEKFDPEKIILFGSYAYGRPHEWRDVDIFLAVRRMSHSSIMLRLGACATGTGVTTGTARRSAVSTDGTLVVRAVGRVIRPYFTGKLVRMTGSGSTGAHGS
jgi:hypothetical protein